MLKKSIAIVALLFAVFFVTEKTFAQATPEVICIWGIGNCPQGGGNKEPGRYVLGEGQSANVLRSINYGARFLLVLRSEAAPNNPGCLSEVRAWVASIEGNNGKQITVKAGPTRTVLVCSTAQLADNINNMELWTQYSRNQIYLWQKYRNEQVTPHLTNPTYQAWAQQEINRANTAISQHDQYIRQAQSIVTPVAP